MNIDAMDAETVLGVIFRMHLESATSAGCTMLDVACDRVLAFSPNP